MEGLPCISADGKPCKDSCLRLARQAGEARSIDESGIRGTMASELGGAVQESLPTNEP